MTNIDLSLYHPYQIEGMQRIGNTHDGGYVVHMPSLQQADCLLNYGVGYNVTFEKEFHRLTGKPVYAFDPTLSSFSYVKNNFKAGQWYEGTKHLARLVAWNTVIAKSLPSKGIHFVEEWLSDSNEDKDGETYRTVAYHIEKYGLQQARILLKIDVEGGEYDVLKDESFYKYLPNVTQMIFEFHYLKERLAELTEYMKRIEQTHTLIHIHANNNGDVFECNGKTVPEVIEVVFLHNSLVPQRVLSSQSYPVAGLDHSTNWRKKDLPVDFFK